MVALSTLMSGAHVRSLRRKAAFEALVTAQQAVGRGDALYCDTDDELVSRLAAIKPCLEEQKKHCARSPTGLVCPRLQLFANAAKHNFSADFRSLTVTEARKHQRGCKASPPLLPSPAPPLLLGLQSLTYLMY